MNGIELDQIKFPSYCLNCLNSSELFCLRERKITNGKKIIMLRLYVHYYLYRSMNSDFIFSISLLDPGIESPSLYFVRTNLFVRKRK